MGWIGAAGWVWLGGVLGTMPLVLLLASNSKSRLENLFFCAVWPACLISLLAAWINDTMRRMQND